jgi:hypothetical protein
MKHEEEPMSDTPPYTGRSPNGLDGNVANPGHRITQDDDLYGSDESVKAQLTNLDTRFRRVVTQRPLVAVAGALLLGLVVGRIVSR